MEKEDIDCFRKNIDTQIKEKYKEIDTNISYIIIGSLGFFITMLEKFIDVKNAFQLPIMIVSVVSLLVAFVVFLYSKHAIAKYASDILNFMDDHMQGAPSTVETDQKLLVLWSTSDTKLRRLRTKIYIFVGLGVILEVVFFMMNVFVKNQKDMGTQQALKIEVIIIDSVNLNNIQKTYFYTIKTQEDARRQKTGWR